jgi:hypothetical protein
MLLFEKKITPVNIIMQYIVYVLASQVEFSLEYKAMWSYSFFFSPEVKFRV